MGLGAAIAVTRSRACQKSGEGFEQHSYRLHKMRLWPGWPAPNRRLGGLAHPDRSHDVLLKQAGELVARILAVVGLYGVANIRLVSQQAVLSCLQVRRVVREAYNRQASPDPVVFSQRAHVVMQRARLRVLRRCRLLAQRPQVRSSIMARRCRCESVLMMALRPPPRPISAYARKRSMGVWIRRRSEPDEPS
jgi:hypothetical protein